MEKTRRIFVLFVAIFFVAAYLFDFETGLLTTLAALSLATLFKAAFGGLGRWQGYDTGESPRRLLTFLLVGLTGVGILWVYGSALIAGALVGGALLAALVAFLIVRD